MNAERENGFVARDSRAKLYRTTLCLAYQSLGVVYGDLSTSPIYVYKSTFSGSLRLYEEDHEILGVLSLVFWTLTVVALCKYVVFVLGADDNGEGGTFALYSLLSRNSKMGLLKSYISENEHITCYDSGTSEKDTRTSLLIKEFFRKNQASRVVLLLIVLLGTSMVISDGILTPTMSVLSAVYGLQIKVPHLHENYTTILPACVILVALFALQHHGTHRVGFLFAPIVLAWVLFIGGVGIYNIFYWNPSVFRALSPFYVYNFFRRAGKVGWRSLGGIVLCITGAEAMYADLGHFSKSSIRVAFASIVYPCLVLAYAGEAAYLSKNKTDIESSFYKALPEVIFWPVFIVATLATVVASQATISATFSIISQCRALGCFPRIKITHTSSQIHGQIYIPEVNWILMFLSISVVIGFREANTIGNAYGLAVITVMFVTTCLMFLIITTVWKQNVLWAFSFVLLFGSAELIYFSSCLSKLHNGGWFPLIASLTISLIMFTWHYGTAKKREFELQNKVSLDDLIRLGPDLGITRVPGICLVYSDVSSGVPPMFAHFVANFPVFHQTLIFVTLQSVMVPKIPVGERLRVGRLGPTELSLFWCVVRYGYMDMMDHYNFETQLIKSLTEFLRNEQETTVQYTADEEEETGWRGNTLNLRSSSHPNEEEKKLLEAKEAGFAYMMGKSCMKATDCSSLCKKLAINVVYGFLRRNSRSPAAALRLPPTSLIEVGMVYRV